VYAPLENGSVKIPLSLLGNGSVKMPLSLLGNNSVETYKLAETEKGLWN
jgi:hypothetical protein